MKRTELVIRQADDLLTIVAPEPLDSPSDSQAGSAVRASGIATTAVAARAACRFVESWRSRL